MLKRIGVMGGTFDPVHIGHLRMAEEALEAFGFDELLFIPAVDPPHKTEKSLRAFEHRLRMLELAVDAHPKFRVSDIEGRLPGKSYTVITLGRLQEEYGPEAELYFLVGLDAFVELDTWWNYRELFERARMVVLSRPGYEEEDVGLFLARKVSPFYEMDRNCTSFTHPTLLPVYCMKNTHLEISSTLIRRLSSRGRSIRYLVLPEVLRYIEKNKLYRGLSNPVQ